MHDHHDHCHGSHAHHHRHEHDDSKHGHHGRGHEHHTHRRGRGSVLVLRPYTGISGDIMVAGLARMLGADQAALGGMIDSIGVPGLAGGLAVVPHSLNEVGGWRCEVALPHEHSHRTLKDIKSIIAQSSMTERAKELAANAFTVLAEAEGAVHGKDADAVSFHEVGALDSILDTCLAAILFDRLGPDHFVCGPLPVCDGTIRCAHGKLPAPAPAVMRLLRDVPVRGIPTSGETITPTGVALLKAFGASFGEWPAMSITAEALVYGSRVFEGVPNGAIFAFGPSLP